MEKIMIVVSAATGEFGRLVVDQLLYRVPASDVAVAVRDVHKAADLADRGVQLRYGDYDEPDSLRDSFNGADWLLFISAPTLGSGCGSSTTSLTRRGLAALAISSTPVGWEPMSAMRADWLTTTPLSGRSNSGLPCTIVRHPIYSEWFINSGLRRSIEAGELTSSSGGRGMNTALRADLARPPQSS
jgi:NAD(P)H dehydrogenase (quinone)